MTTDVAAVLRNAGLLRSVPAPDLERVLAVSRLRTFRRGQVVFTRGDPGDTLMIVVSGRVKVVVRSADGGELTLTIISAGGVFGELCIADGGPRSADAETLEESQLLLIPRETIQEICARVPPAGSDRFDRGRPPEADRGRVGPGLPGSSAPRREGAGQSGTG
jgi:CRP/FNR family cyclic AMP-dependent transcriptional regulator